MQTRFLISTGRFGGYESNNSISKQSTLYHIKPCLHVTLNRIVNEIYKLKLEMSSYLSDI